MKIPWEYCECGCHGGTARIAGVTVHHAPQFGREHLWVTGDLHEETVHPDQVAAMKAGEERLRRLLEERRAQVAELEKIFGEVRP